MQDCGYVKEVTIHVEGSRERAKNSLRLNWKYSLTILTKEQLVNF